MFRTEGNTYESSEKKERKKEKETPGKNWRIDPKNWSASNRDIGTRMFGVKL